MHFNTHDSTYVVKISQTDVVTTYRALELFGTFLPYNEKTPVGEKLVITSMVVIWQLYIVEVLHLETILSYKMLAQQMAVLM